MVERTVIIVVTHNAEKWISTFLGRSSGLPLSNFIIIDNNSTDDTVAKIQSQYSEVRLIESPENLGFGKANNLGLNIAREEKWDFALLLNQDAYIDAPNLHKLIVAYQKEKKRGRPGIVSPVHYAEGGSVDRKFSRYVYPASRPRKNQLSETIEAKFINAAIWLLPLEVLDTVGGFDPLFDHYGEDNDYVNRVLYHNYQLLVVQAARGYHLRPQHVREYSADDRLIKLEKLLLVRMKNVNLPDWKAISTALLALVKHGFRHVVTGNLRLATKTGRLFLKIINTIPRIYTHRRLSKQSGANFIGRS